MEILEPVVRTVVDVLRRFVTMYQQRLFKRAESLFVDIVKYLLTCMLTKQSAQNRNPSTNAETEGVSPNGRLQPLT